MTKFQEGLIVCENMKLHIVQSFMVYHIHLFKCDYNTALCVIFKALIPEMMALY